MACALLKKLQNFRQVLCNVKILNKDVYFNVSILILFVYIFIAYVELWMHLESLESTQEARVALGCARATLTLLSCSPNFPCASITRYTYAKHEPILTTVFVDMWLWKTKHPQKCFQNFHQSHKTDGNILETFPRVFCFPKSRINENGGNSGYALNILIR